MNYYQIEITGYGGESVLGKATKQQYEFWNNAEQLVAAGFTEDNFSAEGSLCLADYMSDIEDWDHTIPKMARFNREWHEIDDYLHINGCALASARIKVSQVNSLEWQSSPDLTVYNDWLIALKQVNENCITSSVLEPDDNSGHYVFYATSVEKGSFFRAVIAVDGEFDLSKLSFAASELKLDSNEDDIFIEGVMYDHREIADLGGDTDGKAMLMEVRLW